MFESRPQFVDVVFMVCLPPKLQLSSSIISWVIAIKRESQRIFYVHISPAKYSTITKLIFQKSPSTHHFKSVVPLYKFARLPYWYYSL